MADVNAGQPDRPGRSASTTSSTPGPAAPYRVYDIAGDKGWGSVGVGHDTAAFAVNTIRSWWMTMGRLRYLDAHTLTIAADGGGSNGSRVRLWKLELQKLADELGLTIVVLHLPPGTSKWNKACPRAGGDRTPSLLVHLAQLEGTAAHRLSHHRRTHRRDRLDDGPDRSVRTR